MHDPEICPGGKFKAQTGGFATCMTTIYKPQADSRTTESVWTFKCETETESVRDKVKKTQSDSGITPQSHAGFIWIRDTWNDKSKWGFSLNEIYSYVCSPFSFYCKHNANFVNYKQPWKTLVKLLILNSRIKTLQFFRIKLNEPESKKLVCIALACTVASYGYQTSFFTEDWKVWSNKNCLGQICSFVYLD